LTARGPARLVRCETDRRLRTWSHNRGAGLRPAVSYHQVPSAGTLTRLLIVVASRSALRVIAVARQRARAGFRAPALSCGAVGPFGDAWFVRSESLAPGGAPRRLRGSRQRRRTHARQDSGWHPLLSLRRALSTDPRPRPPGGSQRPRVAVSPAGTPASRTSASRPRGPRTPVAPIASDANRLRARRPRRPAQ
jgi:hypothetical protein